MPFALGYPRTGIAVIDAVCMQHPTPTAATPGAAPRQRIYSLHLPRSA